MKKSLKQNAGTKAAEINGANAIAAWRDSGKEKSEKGDKENRISLSECS